MPTLNMPFIYHASARTICLASCRLQSARQDFGWPQAEVTTAPELWVWLIQRSLHYYPFPTETLTGKFVKLKATHARTDPDRGLIAGTLFPSRPVIERHVFELEREQPNDRDISAGQSGEILYSFVDGKGFHHDA
ncbi:hypothetical protein [Piscinibacterium candidicorallinum]|uniref:Uncharacterized protein n=1 Tax=Piscinibacterium candidicorallinum TaxID=1793872 RepID=A0ABV7H1B7_9BURK